MRVSHISTMSSRIFVEPSYMSSSRGIPVTAELTGSRNILTSYPVLHRQIDASGSANSISKYRWRRPFGVLRVRRTCIAAICASRAATDQSIEIRSSSTFSKTSSASAIKNP